jgi:hypothetical protein
MMIPLVSNKAYFQLCFNIKSYTFLFQNGSQGEYFLNVTASNELASPKLQNSVVVTITVIENKNYAPVFERDQYSFNVSENAEIGVTIGSVSASDINKVLSSFYVNLNDPLPSLQCLQPPIFF